MPEIIRVGIVGATPERSWAARAHLPALRALPGYEVVAVANSSLASSQAAARALDIRSAHADAAALAADPDVDLVVITVKVPHHRELVDAALNAGKAVLCEWPLGNGLADAEAMATHAHQAGVRTAVGLQARSSPVVRHLRELVRNGYVGEVLSTTLIGSAGAHGPVSPQALAYMNDRAHGATALTIPFGHTLDALCWCLGEVTEVTADLRRRRTTFTVAESGEQMPLEADDQIVVSGQLQSGTVLAAHYRGGTSRGTGLLWEINGTEGDLQITAPLGHIQLAELTLHGGRGDDRQLHPLTVPDHLRAAPSELTGPAATVAEAYLRFAEGPQAADPVPDFDESVRRHEVLDAIERASASGRRILLDRPAAMRGHQESAAARNGGEAREVG